MEKLIKELETQRRACKAEEARLNKDWVEAVDMELSELAAVYDKVRHYHRAKKETLAEVVARLKLLEFEA